MVGGGRPLLSEILDQPAPVGAKLSVYLFQETPDNYVLLATCLIYS